ncbi:AI-2E family transporter [Nocardiopsis metallicus]|uniref:Putative PurR-regulated permease PerM n=1 Tax=Nocardiopsis metallicus TaxID=179819 RepID=A0A840WCA0_9ACTN|nr:AI-2E family transporter [Nocardiopsis metallicus]MBB5490651.1 putative PurR-regulated permease PerM [Nocardiopsis metallicus]
MNKWNAARRARAERDARQEAEQQGAEAEQETEDDARAGDLLRVISDAAWRLLVIGVLAGLLVYALTYLAVVTLPMIIAVFLTALLMPLANWLRRPNPIKRSGFGRGTSTVLTLLVALIVYSGAVTLIVTPAVASFDALVDSVNRAVTQLQTMDLPFGLDPALLTDAINNAWAQVQSLITENSNQILSGAWTATTAVTRVVLGIVLIIVLTIYFVHSGDKLMDWVAGLFPPRSRPTLRHSAQVSYDVMGNYIRGVALVGVFDAVGIGIVLLIVLDTSLAIPLIVLTFIGAFLPIIGAFLSGLIAVLVALVTENWIIALVVLAAVIIVQQLESNVFAPRIYGRALELPSAVVLIALTIGGILGGIAGLFLATPVAAVLAALLRNRPTAHPQSGDEHEGAREEPAQEGSGSTRAGG